MANGDAAAAAGLTTFPSTQDIRMGYDNDNIRGDELAAHLTAGTHPASAITSGVFDAARIPSIDASKITSGTLPVARGGTGAASLTGWVRGNGTSALSTVAEIDCSYLSGNINLPYNGITMYNGNFTNQLKSMGVRNQGTYGSWISVVAMADGVLGVSSSSKRFKKNIKNFSFTLEELLEVQLKAFEYRETSDSSVGVIAEELYETNFAWAVILDKSNKPFAVNYELLGAVAAIGGIQLLAAKTSEIEARLTALEEKN